MEKKENTELLREIQEELYREKRSLFGVCGNGGYYTSQQREYAIEQIDEYGIRATARILQIPRRTLQRWCRKYNVIVKRCPYWVYVWAERRRRRRDFWKRRGYE